MDFRPTGIDWNGGGKSGTVRFGEDQNLLVMFYNRSVLNAVKSAAEDRPIHENQIFIKIQSPGETLNIIDRPMNHEDKKRFPQQWGAFVHNRTQIPEGVPIDLLFPNYPAVAENLRGMGIFTIEQCSKLSASAIDNIGRGGQEYVNRANKYLESAGKGQGFHQLQKEVDQLKATNNRLEQQLGEAIAKLNSVTGRLMDPLVNSNSPPFVVGHDAQSERINANHVTKELAGKAKKKAKAPEPAYDPLTDPLANMGLAVQHSGEEVADG